MKSSPVKNGARDLKEFTLQIFHVQPIGLHIIGTKLYLDGCILGKLRGTRCFFIYKYLKNCHVQVSHSFISLTINLRPNS